MSINIATILLADDTGDVFGIGKIRETIDTCQDQTQLVGASDLFVALAVQCIQKWRASG